MKSQVAKWILVGGARPNFMKIAPLLRAVRAQYDKNSTRISPVLVHTGQHYDVNMSDSFFKDLSLPEPDIYLGVGSGTHAEQTGKILIEFEKVLFKERPDLLIVVGDVNSTLACTLAAAKLHIPVAHVEAGLRSFDRRMPEEINRILTDALSDYLFTPSHDADENLKREGISEDKIFLVGDVMLDNLLFNLEKAKKSSILKKLGLQQGLSNGNCQLTTDYALLTLHRPSNVDDKDAFLRIIHALTEIAKRVPVVFPAHPRTRKQIETFGFQHYFANSSIHDGDIRFMGPLGCLDFLKLMTRSKFVMTDSGGVQEETAALGIPCLTLRDTTERMLTISEGTNVLVENDTEKIIAEAFGILDGKDKKENCPQLGDGKASERIVRVLVDCYGE